MELIGTSASKDLLYYATMADLVRADGRQCQEGESRQPRASQMTRDGSMVHQVVVNPAWIQAADTGSDAADPLPAAVTH
jgi:hypothetical protein